MKNFLNNKLTYIVLLVIVVITASVLIFSLSSNNTVAKVNGEKITKDDLYDTLVKYYGAQALDTMITEKIVELETKKANITVTDAEVQKEIDVMIESSGGQEVYELQLAQQGITSEDMKVQITSYLKTMKLLEPRIKITDEEISTYLEENKATLALPEKVEASHILVADEATAIDVKKQLDQGGDFTELAAKYSTDTDNAQNGGELGLFGKGEMVAAFDTVVFSMKIGEISDPVKTEFGYHVIKLTDKQEAQEANLENSKTIIEETLKDEKINTEYSAWLTETKAEYDIYNSLVKE